MPRSVEIKHKIIQGRDDGPHLLISGGVHGDEYEPMKAVRRLIREVNPDELRGRLTLVPCLNEPAFENAARCAHDEKDLSRTFPGRSDGTITERVAHAAAPFIRTADYFIDLHTGGRVMAVVPMSGYTLHADEKVLEVQRRMARAFNLPVIWGTNPNLDGRSLSVARDAKVPAIYAEWMGGNGCNPEGVDDYVEGCLNVMAELDMIDRAPPRSRIRHVVEDNRPNSGYLQINYNAKANGYFEPVVKLDDLVQISDTLGMVVDPVGEVLETVVSKQQGIVLALRTLPRVDQGDCLAVILEL